MTLKILAAAALAVTIGLGTAAQGTAQDVDDQLELSAEEVLLDIIATDSKGRPVTDLRRDEIEVYEGGKRQEVTSFALVETSSATATAAPDSKAPVSIELSPFRGFNYIIIVVDRTSLNQQDLQQTRAAAERFINERSQPNDLVAVFVAANRLLMLQNFTNSRPRLLKAVQAATDTSGTVIQLDSGDRLASQVQLFSDPIAGTGALATADASGSTTLATALTELNTLGASVTATYDDLVLQFQGVALVHDLLALMKIYSRIPGRKSVVLYSEGFVVDSVVEGSFSSLIGTANRNNFAFYTVDAAGLRPAPQTGLTAGGTIPLQTAPIGPGQDRSSVDASGNSSLGRAERNVRTGANGALHRLAVDTGGVPVRNTNDLGKGFKAVESDLRSYYALSYAPSSAALDGKYRPIDVKVTRKGVDLRTRKGYYATAGGGVLLPFEQPVLEMIAAAKPDNRPAALPVMLRTDRFRAENGWSVPVYASVAASSLEPAERKDDKGNVTGYEFEVDMVAVVRDAKSRAVVAKVSRSFLYQSTKERMEAFRQLDLLNTFSQPLQLAPGTYVISVAVYDPHSSKGTVVERSILLPQAAPGTPMLSSIVLSRDVVPVDAQERARASSDPLVFEDTTRIVPNASNRFVKSNGDRLVTFFRFYGAPSKQYQAKIELVRDGQVVSASKPADLPLTNAAGETSFAPSLPIASLDPGAYLVRVVVSDPSTAQPAATGTANFRVDP